VNAPSLRVTWVHAVGDMKTSTTQYICGRNKRIERRSCNGHSDTTFPTKVRYEYGPLRAAIFNRDLGYAFEVEPASGVYTAFRANEYGSPIWSKPQRLAEIKPSGKTRHCHLDTVDTGERREMFGYIARHIVTKNRQSRDSQLLGESEVDAWYVDPPAAWRSLHPPLPPGVFTYLYASPGENDDYKFTEAGRQERVLCFSPRERTCRLSVMKREL
jgi:hypothetical protein